MSPGASAALLAATVGATACTSFDPAAWQASQSTSAAATTRDPVGFGGQGGAGGAALSPLEYCGDCALSGAQPLQQQSLAEASGMAASRVHEGVFYLHNDSGNTAHVFAVKGDGATVGIFALAAANIDWEDIAVGPCPSGHCIFVADIGDNDAVRPGYTLYRAPEPATLGKADLAPEAFPFTYEDGPHNAETLLVHPITGEIVVVTKVKAGPSAHYRAPSAWSAGEAAVFTRQGEIPLLAGSPRITGGSVHPAGLGVLLRTYTHLHYFAASTPDAPLGETLSHAPCPLPVAEEAQGEAVSWTATGDGYLTLSEGPSPIVHHASCHAQ